MWLQNLFFKALAAAMEVQQALLDRDGM